MSLVLFPNPDKKNCEHWTPDRDLANIISPSRILVASKPNCGKTTTILNLILRQSPPFRKIYLLHPNLKSQKIDQDDTDDEEDAVVREYENIDYIPLFDIPDPVYFKDDKNEKKLLIIDDMELKTLSKLEKKRLNKIMSFASSHYNMTIMVSSQDIFSQLNCALVRFCNVFIMYPYSDINYNRMMLNRFGMNKKDTEKVINEMKNYGLHDNLTIDRTENTPAKYRKNIYVPLKHLE